MATDLQKVAKERKIKYFLISYVDLFGGLRAKLVPAAAIGAMQRDGAGFAGFATWLDMTPADPDLFAKPDPDSLIQLPWKPEVGWLAADLWMDGKEVAASPRAMRTAPRAPEAVAWRAVDGNVSVIDSSSAAAASAVSRSPAASAISTCAGSKWLRPNGSFGLSPAGRKPTSSEETVSARRMAATACSRSPCASFMRARPGSGSRPDAWARWYASAAPAKSPRWRRFSPSS